MVSEQQVVSRTSSDRFSRYEQGQAAFAGKNFGPTQKTDVEMKEAIYHALWEDAVLRALEYHEMDVYVNNGIVYLNGHIVSTNSMRRVENAIRGIPGIVGIKNNLVLDDKLRVDVAISLSDLEHKYHCKFFTGASHGVISLNGIVSDKSVKLLAEQCASSNPRVRGVLNDVRISGMKPGLQPQPFLQPAIGAIIYFLDGVLGVVRQVIINPDNRCAIQIVLQGQFSGQKQSLSLLTNNQAEILQNAIVIPVNLIRYLTHSSGFLTIKSTETTCYEDFNPLSFIAPPTDWALPYPYRSGDVLFIVDRQEIQDQIMVSPDLAQLNASAQPTSPRGPEAPVDIITAWEDDGGQIIQIAKPASRSEIL